MMVMMTVVLGQQILTRLRQLSLMFAQALADAPGAGGNITAERLHVAPTRLLPGGDLGLHLIQVLLAGRRQHIGVLLQAARKRAGAGREVRAERRQTIAEAAGAGCDIGAKRLQVLTTCASTTVAVGQNWCHRERQGERRDEHDALRESHYLLLCFEIVGRCGVNGEQLHADATPSACITSPQPPRLTTPAIHTAGVNRGCGALVRSALPCCATSWAAARLLWLCSTEGGVLVSLRRSASRRARRR
jgi:hypothetical protein